MDPLWLAPAAAALAAAGAALARTRRRLARVLAERDEAQRRHQETLLRMERDRQAALDRVDAMERRFTRVVEASGDAMLLLSPRGRVVTANAAATRLLGAPLEDVLGCAANDLVDAAGDEAVALRHDGARVPVVLARAAWKEAGRPHAVMWLRDPRQAAAPPPGDAGLATYNGT